jgi:hypothetical protein
LAFVVPFNLPTGEGQHVVIPRYPDPYVANRKLRRTPTQATITAIGLTALLAIVGKSRPGTFLKTTAYLSAANISISACQLYGEREINRGVFKLDKIEPTPGKLWERTKHWTCDDAVIGGGLLATVLAFNPRALPGVGGWKRLLGVATVGCMLGGMFGDTYIPGGRSPQMINMIYGLGMKNRMVAYTRLQEDTEAKESLSRVGKLALAWYTSPFTGIRLNPFARGTPQEAETGSFEHSLAAAQRRSQDEMSRITLIQLEFAKGELNGPDVENGYRAYREDPTEQNKSALQDWLERLEEVRRTTSTEAQYMWHHLATKEKEFYSIAEEDREKDIVRREIQLLNSIASDFASRDAVLAYHITDAMKRLQHIEKDKESSDQNLLLVTRAVQNDLPADWRENYNPHSVTEHIRTSWSRQKELLGFLEQATSLHGDMQLESGSPQEAHLKQIKQNAEDMKKNVEATERLLKDFEEQVRRADERSGK